MKTTPIWRQPSDEDNLENDDLMLFYFFLLYFYNLNSLIVRRATMDVNKKSMNLDMYVLKRQKIKEFRN